MQDARILIMDDEAQERSRIESFLKQKGYDVTSLASVPEAMAAMQRERYDVFLTDCNIPGVDALRTSDEARRINPDMAVIIMTSFGTIETAVKAIRAGATMTTCPSPSTWNSSWCSSAGSPSAKTSCGRMPSSGNS